MTDQKVVSSYLQNGIVSDPAVPMIQLPMQFTSKRQNTNVPQNSSGDKLSVDILNVEGSGCVRHIWFLYAQGRTIEICVDDAVVPQVKMPLASFLGVMHQLTPYFIDCAAYTVLPNYDTPNTKVPGNPGYNLYLPVPFRKSCRITLHVDWLHPHDRVSTMVDWQEYRNEAAVTPFRLHAEHHLYTPAPPRNHAYQIADVSGSGFLAGVVLGVKQRNNTDAVFHTGGMSILLDGETDPNVIRGINMEDDFGFSWGFQLRQTRWIGVPYHKWRGVKDQDGVVYRFFGPDPIWFDSSMSFRSGSREDDVETVAYYYSAGEPEATTIATPEKWLITGFYEQGNNWDAFNVPQPVEMLPLAEWQPQFSNDSEKIVREIKANRGWLDLRFSGMHSQQPGNPFVNQSLYAGGYLISDRDKETTLRLSFDDWLTLWINGHKVQAFRHDNGFETVRVPVKLKQGSNELLIKNNNLYSPHNSWIVNCVLE